MVFSSIFAFVIEESNFYKTPKIMRQVSYEKEKEKIESSKLVP